MKKPDWWPEKDMKEDVFGQELIPRGYKAGRNEALDECWEAVIAHIPDLVQWQIEQEEEDNA